MKNNRYFFVIILRIILITFNCYVLIWFFTETSRPATTLFFLILLIFQTASLIFYLNKINRDLANFLIYLQENDASLVFSKNRVEKNFKNVMTGLNEINRKIQNGRILLEEKHQYLKAVIEHLDMGILSYNSNGQVELINKAALDLFGFSSLTNMEILFHNIPELKETLAKPGTRIDGLVKTRLNGKTMDLSVKSGKLNIGNELITLLSFQNIKRELEEKELESWKKLIRVLRHEIMNSITPVTTLTTAIKRCFSQKSLKEITNSNIEDALLSADVIEERSKGLISFVEKFRSITDLPKPQLKLFYIDGVFQKVKLLFAGIANEKKITISLNINPNDLKLFADEHLIEQVLINLVKNSIEAIDNDGIICLKALKQSSDKIIIQVIDNGKGITSDDMENIFVPSFTTKEDGMGIGLSISKQIVQMHHGQITVQSIPGEETVFEITI